VANEANQRDEKRRALVVPNPKVIERCEYLEDYNKGNSYVVNGNAGYFDAIANAQPKEPLNCWERDLVLGAK
jgi:hypothetical protein